MPRCIFRMKIMRLLIMRLISAAPSCRDITSDTRTHLLLPSHDQWPLPIDSFEMTQKMDLDALTTGDLPAPLLASGDRDLRIWDIQFPVASS